VTGDGRLVLSQKRFRTIERGELGEPPWRIPMTIECSDGDTVRSLTLLFDERERTVDLPTGKTTRWVHPNAGERGYYRWDVGGDMLRALVDAGAQDLDVRTRKGVVSNATALLLAGRLAGPDFLEILRRAAGDPNPQVIDQVLTGLETVRASLIDDDQSPAFATFVRRTLAPVLDRIGLEARRDEPEAVTGLRPSLLRWLADAGRDSALLVRARQLADAYMEEPSSVEPSLVGTVLRLAAIQGDRDRFERYRQRFETTAIPTERVDFLAALAWFDDDALVEEALRYALEGPLRPNEVDDIAREMIAQRAGRGDRVWRWLTENYDALAARTPPILQPAFTRFAGGCSAQRIDEARTFFSSPEHAPTGTAEELEKTAEKVEECVALHDREGAAVATYLTRAARSGQKRGSP